ncbi:MAG: hypothetical protein V7709_01585 [Halioglobus sp.]
MNTVLVILAVLGLGAMLIAAYVFTVSARKNITESYSDRNNATEPGAKPHIRRSEFDRRQRSSGSFPITVNGMTIETDRRLDPDRRLAA